MRVLRDYSVGEGNSVNLEAEAPPTEVNPRARRRELEALESKSPPFAKFAKGRAPSSFGVERRNE